MIHSQRRSQHGDTCVPMLQASKTKDKDGDEATQKNGKEAQKEELDRQNRAQTNKALTTALGSGARWQQWGGKGKSGSGASHMSYTVACLPCIYWNCLRTARGGKSCLSL